MGKQMGVNRVMSSAGVAGAITVASTGTVFTHSMKISRADLMNLRVQGNGTGVDIDVYYEVSHTLTGVTEGSAAGVFLTSSKIADLTSDGTWVDVSLSPDLLPYIRFKYIGQGTNPADATVDAYLITQGED